TKTLTARIQYLLETRKVKPSEITAVTFTNLAAKELKERLEHAGGGGRSLSRLQVGTCHGICLELLKNSGSKDRTVPEEERRETAGETGREYGRGRPAKELLREVAPWKTGDGTGGVQKETGNGAVSSEALESYHNKRRDRAGYDFDERLLGVL